MNTLYQGDNLAILREIPDNSIDLIATDPPFNTGRDWGAFNDKWEGGLKGYLKFMEARCVEMHRVLKDTGSLYLHCDPTASHYLKVMLDGIFGVGNFRNEIVWKRQSGRTNHVRTLWSKEHDVILFYTSSNKYTFNPIYQPLTEDSLARYSKTDEDGRKYYLDRGNRQRKQEARRYYLDELKGAVCDTLWIKGLQLGSVAKERLGYPTQKPVVIYERIIKASSNEGDIVLDPFAGSGTTLDAAQSLNRNWIGIDSGEQAIETIIKRMEDRHGLFLECQVVKKEV